ncbi:MAG TPA: hypothetical protein VEI01_22705 [Terriglobales bacterium]|nr:hypothetical protein [Terriglobales bacterium]
MSPKAALGVGLKVDVDALPASLVEQLKQGKVNLDDPAVTLALLKLNSVIGVTGFFNPDGSLKSVGSSEDTLGILCGRYAVSTCTDCGTSLCLSHAETCHICHKVFCGACLGFHLDGHAKPAKKDVTSASKKRTA